MKHFYIIVERDNWTNFKLGFAGNAGQRLAYLQIGNPVELSVCSCALIKNYKQFEKFVHQAFKDNKIRGEWFNLNSEELRLLYDVLENSKEECECLACLGFYSAPKEIRKTSKWKLVEGVYVDCEWKDL